MLVFDDDGRFDANRVRAGQRTCNQDASFEEPGSHLVTDARILEMLSDQQTFTANIVIDIANLFSNTRSLSMK